ncbi:MAG: homogentisate phytyltransferase [Saprospiraceae bacterium]
MTNPDNLRSYFYFNEIVDSGMQNKIRNFLLFSRLHTVIGTLISIFSLYLIALSGNPDVLGNFHYLLLTWIACLGANIYIVGLNQLTDIEIDKLNKPYLPLASGAYTKSLARRIIGIAFVIAVGVGIYCGGFLLATILLSLFLGTIYSLPPFRLKRFYFWAAFCIIAVRGLIVNFGLFLHFNTVMNQSVEIPQAIWMLASTIFVYSLVIAWFKDIPDIEGDQNHKISTLSIKLGARKVFLIGNLFLLVLYSTIISIGIRGHLVLLVISHSIFILLLLVIASRVKPTERRSISRYYQFVWVLFFLEYIIFALESLN